MYSLRKIWIKLKVFESLNAQVWLFKKHLAKREKKRRTRVFGIFKRFAHQQPIIDWQSESFSYLYKYAEKNYLICRKYEYLTIDSTISKIFPFYGKLDGKFLCVYLCLLSTISISLFPSLSLFSSHLPTVPARLYWTTLDNLRCTKYQGTAYHNVTVNV